MFDKKNKHTLSVKNLFFGYSDKEDILKDLNFEIKSGESLCLLGPNGCGKTTLLNCLIGLNKVSSGQVLIDDVDVIKMPEKKLSLTFGYVPQTIIPTFDYTVLDYVVCGCAPYLKLFEQPKDAEYEKALKALEKLNIVHLKDKSYAQISGGEMQLVCIARVLCQSPDFILLDEPTSHLDFGNQISILELVKKLTKNNFGVIMTTHNPNHALSMNDKTVLIKENGDYVFGRTSKILDQSKLRDLYNIDLYLEESANTKQKYVISPKI